MDDIDIARVGADDWEEFREVRLASLEDSPTAFGSRYDDWVDAPEARWRSRLTDVPLTLVARQGGRLVGVASGAPDGDDVVELISMWVAPQARGTGLADALIASVVAWAAAQQRSTVLMVRSDNARALAAYTRAGFVDTGVPDDHPADEPPENRMVRALSTS